MDELNHVVIHIYIYHFFFLPNSLICKKMKGHGTKILYYCYILPQLLNSEIGVYKSWRVWWLSQRMRY